MGGSGARGPSARAAATERALPEGPSIILAAAERGAGKSTAFALAAAEASALGWEPCGIVCPGVYRDGLKESVLCRALSSDGSADEPWELARLMPDYDPAGASRPGLGPGSSGGPRPAMLDEGSFSYGKWEFSTDGLRRADAACLEALADPLRRPRIAGSEADTPGHRTAAKRRIVFVDEIGPLELRFGLGLAGTVAAIDRLAAASPGRRAGVNAESGGIGAEEAPAAIVAAVRPELAEVLAERWPGSLTIRAAAATMAAEALAAEVVAALRSALGRGPLAGCRRTRC